MHALRFPSVQFFSLMLYYHITERKEEKQMINFESDYTEGCIPEILQAMQKAQAEQNTGYGMDPHCEHAAALIREFFHATHSDVHFLVGGTQANMTVIAASLKPYQGVICASSGHINVHETGAVEASGHKCIPVETKYGKISAEHIETAIVDQKYNESFEHIVQPKMVYISFPTETGTLYSRAELMAIHDVCVKYGVYLFIDGARLGYGLAAKANDVKPEDFAELCDVFYAGGTKVGALFGEAVVINNDALKEDFRYSIKQRGGMLAKGWFLGIQFETLFEESRYLTISNHAMEMAYRLEDALKAKGYAFQTEPQTNQLFPILSNEKIKELRQDFAFHTNGVINKDHTAVRFVTSWATKPENIDRLIEAL